MRDSETDGIPVLKWVPDLPEDERIKWLRYNKVGVLAYNEIKSGSETIDDRLNSIIQAEYKQSVARSMQFEAAFRTVIPLLQKNDIETVILKGCALASDIYTNTAERGMVDIDLLIAEKDKDKARAILLQNGATETYLMESTHTMGHWKHAPPLLFRSVAIELHHHLFDEFEQIALKSDEIFRNLNKRLVYGLECKVLAPEYELFHLCTHLYHHIQMGSIKLIWLIDIHLHIQKYHSKYHLEKWNKLLNQTSMQNEVSAIISGISGLFDNNQDKSLVISTAKVYSTNHLTSICSPRNPNDVKIGSLDSIQKLNGIKSKLLFVRGKAFPRPGYIAQKFELHGIAIVRGYFMLYGRYIVKLYKALTNKISSR